MSNDILTTMRKPIKIHWIAPNGKNYEDTINMTLDEYTNFVNGMLEIKKGSQSHDSVKRDD